MSVAPSRRRLRCSDEGHGICCIESGRGYALYERPSATNQLFFLIANIERFYERCECSVMPGEESMQGIAVSKQHNNYLRN
jgi:hypothetical protein